MRTIAGAATALLLWTAGATAQESRLVEACHVAATLPDGRSLPIESVSQEHRHVTLVLTDKVAVEFHCLFLNLDGTVPELIDAWLVAEGMQVEPAEALAVTNKRIWEHFTSD
jgi:hypothetical protein